jgi:hypothetical protein
MHVYDSYPPICKISRWRGRVIHIHYRWRYDEGDGKYIERETCMQPQGYYLSFIDFYPSCVEAENPRI